MRKAGRTWIQVVRGERTVEFHLVSAIPGSAFRKVLLAMPATDFVVLRVERGDKGIFGESDLLWGVTSSDFPGTLWVGSTQYVRNLAEEGETGWRRRETVRLALTCDSFMRSEPPSEKSREMLREAVLKEWKESSFWSKVAALIGPAAEAYSVLET